MEDTSADCKEIEQLFRQIVQYAIRAEKIVTSALGAADAKEAKDPS